MAKIHRIPGVSFSQVWGVFFSQLEDEITEHTVDRGPLYERKVAIYQKALEANPNSDELLCGYLFCCEQVWEYACHRIIVLCLILRYQKVSDLWEKTVAAHPDSSRLWRHYMQYSLSHLATMTMTRLRLTIANALKVLAAQKKYYQV